MKMGYGFSEPQITHSELKLLWTRTHPIPLICQTLLWSPGGFLAVLLIAAVCLVQLLTCIFRQPGEVVLRSLVLIVGWPCLRPCLRRSWKHSPVEEGCHQFIDLQQMWCATMKGVVEVQGK